MFLLTWHKTNNWVMCFCQTHVTNNAVRSSKCSWDVLPTRLWPKCALVAPLAMVRGRKEDRTVILHYFLFYLFGLPSWYFFVFFQNHCLGYLVTCPVIGYFGNGNCPAGRLWMTLMGNGWRCVWCFISQWSRHTHWIPLVWLVWLVKICKNALTASAIQDYVTIAPFPLESWNAMCFPVERGSFSKVPYAEAGSSGPQQPLGPVNDFLRGGHLGGDFPQQR